MMSGAATWSKLGRFYVVGLLGMVVQLLVLRMLTEGGHFHYLVSTVIAVELAVIHNFFWHDRWTWPSASLDSDSVRRRAIRFCKFNLSTGLVSMVTNVIVTRTLVDSNGIQYVAANLVAIVFGSVATFVLSEVWVFAKPEF